MATIPARTAAGMRCQTAASSATSGGIASASIRNPNRSAWSDVAAATAPPERAGGQTASPFASPSRRPLRKWLLSQGVTETASNPTPSAFWIDFFSAAEQLFRIRKPAAISLGTDLAFRGLVACAAGSSTPWRPQRAGRTKDKPATYVSVPSVWSAQVLGPVLHLIPNRFFRSGSIAEFTCTRNELGSGVLMMSSNVSVSTSSSSAKPSMTWSR